MTNRLKSYCTSCYDDQLYRVLGQLISYVQKLLEFDDIYEESDRKLMHMTMPSNFQLHMCQLCSSTIPSILTPHKGKTSQGKGFYGTTKKQKWSMNMTLKTSMLHHLDEYCWSSSLAYIYSSLYPRLWFWLQQNLSHIVSSPWCHGLQYLDVEKWLCFL